MSNTLDVIGPTQKTDTLLLPLAAERYRVSKAFLSAANGKKMLGC